MAVSRISDTLTQMETVSEEASSRGKGPGKGEGKRRRLHGRSVPAFLASVTGPQDGELFLGAGRGRRRASGHGKGRRGDPRDVNGGSHGA
eukprot:137550-Pyramimonas_sp.AAC.1